MKYNKRMKPIIEKLSNLNIAENLNKEGYFSFGLIADIQYADLDDGHNFKKTSTR